MKSIEMRNAGQVSFPAKNHGFWLRAHGEGDTIDIATPASDEVLLRPRLMVSCHGDLLNADNVLLQETSETSEEQ